MEIHQQMGQLLQPGFHSTCSSDFGPPYTKIGQSWCDHCKHISHTKETYWKIHDKLADWKPRSRGNLATSDTLEPVTKEQLEALRKALQNRISQEEGT